MMAHGDDGLCLPETGCRGCAQGRRWKEEAKTDRRAAVWLFESGVKLDREILVRWGLAENYKPKMEEEDNGKRDNPARRGKTGKAGRITGGASKTVEEGPDGGQDNAVGVGKPGVDMEALRDICAGNRPRIPPEIIAAQDAFQAEATEVDLCGFKSYNEIDGENYVCGKEKHGPKVQHGDWIKV